MPVTTVDPWETAETAKEMVFSSVYWGQVEASSWYCVLEKGVGKVPFNAQNHSQDKRRTAIDLLVRPLPEMGLTFDVSRGMVAESHEWAGIILPSLRDLGIQARELNGKWVKAERVPLIDRLGNPTTYVDKQGQVKEQTTIKFVAVFADEASCRADYLNGNGKNGGMSVPTPPAAQPVTPGDNPERRTALAFLRSYVQNAARGQTNLDVIRQTLALNIAEQPLISKYFTADSPETIQLIAEYMGE